MQPPIALPDPNNPSFTVVNDARSFDPFDPVALQWTAAASPQAREAALAKFRLGLEFTIQRATSLFAPCRGEVSWMVTRTGTTVTSRTLVLALEPAALTKLHLAGRQENQAEPGNVSAFPWSSVSGQAVQVRLLFTFGAPLLQRLEAQVAALYGAGHLERGCDPDVDLRFVDGVLTPFEIPGSTPEQRLDLWMGGESAVSWRLTGNDAQNKLADLQPNDVVLVQALIRDGFTHSATDHWYLCNVGLLVRSLGLLGDPADSQHDNAYRVLAGDSFAPVMSGGTFASGGTNPAGPDPYSFADVVVVRGGSQGGVLLQPPSDSVVPGCVFSFTTAEDVFVFSPRIEDQPVGLRVWQPTYDLLDLGMVQDRIVAAGGKRSQVWVPPANEPILTTEYGYPARGMPYPKARDRVFLPETESAYGYDEARALPPAPSAPFALAALTTWEQSFNLNEIAAIRPEHPRWRLKSKGQVYAKVRRLFPLRVEIRLGGAVDSPVLCTISQDDVDCVRQDYIFHMAFTADYYQDYVGVWSAGTLPNRVFRSPTHRLTVDGANKPIPAIGANHAIHVPTRREVRPVIRRADQRYRYTLLRSDFQVRIAEAEGLGEVYADQVRAILASPALVTAILQARQQNTDYTDPVVLPSLPPYAAEVAATVVQLVGAGATYPADDPRGFLRALLLDQDALNRFNGLAPFALQLGSSWRPPEHNESPSTTPASNHQRGEAFDKQPAGTGLGRRNPLAQMCLHLVGQDLLTGGRLEEMLLENQASAYLSQYVDPVRRTHVIIANFAVNGSVTFRIRAPNGTEDQLPTQTEADGEPLTNAQLMSSNLANDFLGAYREYRGMSGPIWPVPPPTYIQMYIFGLLNGSHVHFTWK